MSDVLVADSVVMDQLEQQLVRCLQIAPRAPFSLFAEVLGVSEHTVARRYRRLHRSGVLRVVGVPRADALGQSTWTVRIQCRPNGAASLAAALARREDVNWVTLNAGGSEVMCSVQSLSEAARDHLLVQKLPHTAPVLGVTAAVILHIFVGASVARRWAVLAGLLTKAQERRLRAAVEPVGPLIRDAELDPADAALLDELARDGRATYAALGAAAGLSEARAKRRLTSLLHQGVAYIETDVTASALGLNSHAVLWLRVNPAQLEAAGEALAGSSHVAYAAAVTGPYNLTAAVYSRDLDALYRFVTTEVGSLPGVQAMEISPVLGYMKQAGTLLANDRFVD